MRDYPPIEINNFLGLYDRGSQDSVIADHQGVCSNTMFQEREVLTRFGTSLNFTNVENIKRIELYKRIGEATRLLILDASGNLYDSTQLAPILSIDGMTDFRMQNFYGRAYITPIDAANGIGVAGEFVYVYSGSGSARKAAGVAPTGTLVAAASATSGNVESGFHLYAVAYETASGFITKPGPALYALLESDGTKKVDLSSIPVGPSGTVKRHLLATKSILAYDGNQNGYEFFFIPGGAIEDNSGTTITVNFFDADLLSSAEYLFDQYEEINAGAGISEFAGRLIVWAENYVFLSKPGEPESFDALTGLVLVGPSETGYITDCVEFREMLYINKEARAYTTSDNGGDPSSWKVTSLDKGNGCSIHGIIKILDSQGVSLDKFVVASAKGLVLFNGIFNEPELSYKIEEVWKRINKDYLYLVHGCNDTFNKRMYIAIPLDAATSCSHILYADYSRGLDAVNIRWSLWSSAKWNPTSILMDIDSNTPYLRIGSLYGVFDQDTSTKQDEDLAITTQVQTGLNPAILGYINQLTSVRIRAAGSGTLETRTYGQDANLLQTLAEQTLTSSPGRDYTLLANSCNEKLAVDFKTVDLGDWLSLSHVILHIQALWESRPIL